MWFYTKFLISVINLRHNDLVIAGNVEPWLMSLSFILFSSFYWEAYWLLESIFVLPTFLDDFLLQKIYLIIMKLGRGRASVLLLKVDNWIEIILHCIASFVLCFWWRVIDWYIYMVVFYSLHFFLWFYSRNLGSSGISCFIFYCNSGIKVIL